MPPSHLKLYAAKNFTSIKKTAFFAAKLGACFPPGVLPSPERLVAGRPRHRLAAIVRGEDDDGLVQHPLVGERGLDPANGVVHGGDHGGSRLALAPGERAPVFTQVLLHKLSTIFEMQSGFLL